MSEMALRGAGQKPVDRVKEVLRANVPRNAADFLAIYQHEHCWNAVYGTQQVELRNGLTVEIGKAHGYGLGLL